MIPSWNADTPAGTWIVVELQAKLASGALTKWYAVARWAFGDGDIRRASVGGGIEVDTFVAKESPLVAYRLRLTLAGSSAGSPRVTRVAAVASDVRTVNTPEPSATTMSRTLDLGVPAYSQELHRGEYPELDGGGESWCSPTATSMVLAYWRTGPSPADYAYVHLDYPDAVDPWVAYAARHTYDHDYCGAGNWAFNVAYAAHFGLIGSVTRLRSLVEAEQLVEAGIPLVASITVEPGALDGFLLPSSRGHLLVIGGFTSTGDVIAYDPAATSNASVRRVYDRAQLERAWLGGSGGVVYLVHPPSVGLPPSTGSW